MKASRTLDDFVHIQGKQLLLGSFALGLCSGVGRAPAQAAALQILAAALAGQGPTGLAGQAAQGLWPHRVSAARMDTNNCARQNRQAHQLAGQANKFNAAIHGFEP